MTRSYVSSTRATVRRATAAIGCGLSLAAALAGAEERVAHILVQDPALNNLVDPPGAATAEPGTLGGVLRAGQGTRPMILIPGLGFGGALFDDLARTFAADFSTYAVTLAGMGGTAPPPGPGEATSFGEQTWTRGALRAIEKLMIDEKIEGAVVVGHWLAGTQIALRLALERPESVKAVVLLAGSARMMATDPARAAFFATPEKRLASTDQFLAPRWFKTVTRETWDDNNFLPGDYAVHPVRGLRLWREAARPPLHVWVRYLNEFNAQDICVDLPKLRVPTLLLAPGLEGLAHDPGADYMKGYLHDSWVGCADGNPALVRKVIPDARVALWFDQPEAVESAMREFLASLGDAAPTPAARP